MTKMKMRVGKKSKEIFDEVYSYLGLNTDQGEEIVFAFLFAELAEKLFEDNSWLKNNLSPTSEDGDWWKDEQLFEIAMTEAGLAITTDIEKQRKLRFAIIEWLPLLMEIN